MLEDIAFLLSDVPFRPFQLITSDGKSYRVESPKQISLPDHGKSVHLTKKDGQQVIIATRHLMCIEVAEHHH